MEQGERRSTPAACPECSPSTTRHGGAAKKMSSRNRRSPSRQQLRAEIEAVRAVNERLQAQAEERERAHEELRAQEQTVRARENELRLVVNTVPVLIAYVDSRFHYRWVNQGYERWFGLPTPEVEGRHVRDVLGRKAWEIIRPYLERARAGEVVTYEEWMPYRLGESRCVCVTCVPDGDEAGRMRGFIAHVIDITMRKRAEEALRRTHESLQMQSEELAAANEELRTRSEELQAQSLQLRETSQRLRLALEAADMGRWEWDLQTDAVSWCARSGALLDLDPATACSTESFLRCVHPDDRDAMQKLVARTRAEPADFQVDFRVRRHRQDVRAEIAWLTSRGRVIRDEQGRAVRVIGVLYDVTQRKQMEERLRRLNDQLEEEVQAQTEELRHTIDRLQDEVVRRVLAEGKLRRRSQMLEGFFQHTIAPLAFLDRRCNFVRVNEAYARAEGRDAQSLVGQSYFALHPDVEDQVLFLQVVRNKQPYRAYARRVRYPGDPRAATYWDWQLTPLLDERGQVQFLVFNLEDVTERQKAFEELEQRAHQLQKLTLELAQAEDCERRRLAEILHDDLQQQLAAAKFHLGILSGYVRNDETVQELAGQINQMLKEAIAKSRSLSHELSPAVLYQSDLGETFEWLARQMEAKHGLRVHVEVRGRVSSQTDALKAFLYRSAQELLFNVIKHARVREARLRLQHVRGRLWLTVSDQGPGFEMPTLGRTAGFGLLGIRERVELLGGRMKIRSAKGRGSTFLIAVPEVTTSAGVRAWGAAAPTESATGRTKPPVEIPPEQRLHVLLVDDHEVMREGLAALLAEQTDIEVVGQAGNGREAADLAHRLRPEVVVMDVAMPVMAGDEATRQIKLHLPGIRVIALSMFDEPEMAERMRRAGAAAYLLKTGPSEDLLAAIRGRSKP
jgi:PAS domain S-box-containing protein